MYFSPYSVPFWLPPFQWQRIRIGSDSHELPAGTGMGKHRKHKKSRRLSRRREREQRQQRQARPDQVAQIGPLDFARWGPITKIRNVMDPAQQAEVLEHLAGSHPLPRIEAEVDEHVRSAIAIVDKADSGGSPPAWLLGAGGGATRARPGGIANRASEMVSEHLKWCQPPFC